MRSIKNSPQGIDLSDNNGLFDWPAWNGHLDFAMIKATEGPTQDYQTGYRDHQFERNWAEAEKMGIFRFAYHYAHPDGNPGAQAKYFVDTVKAQGMHIHDNFVLDLEVSDNVKPITVSFWAYVFCETVNRLTHGQRILVYTFPAFADAGYCAKLGHRELWIANFDTPQPHIPLPWRTWAFWQYAGTGLDRDVFNGSEKDLEKFCTR